VDSQATAFAQAAFRYVGARSSQLGSGKDMPEYGILDLRAGVKLDSGLNVALFADNVTNKIAVNQIVAAALANFSHFAINRPRTIDVNVEFEF
jgi:outer membrane receptor protein involved in Fe transport